MMTDDAEVRHHTTMRGEHHGRATHNDVGSPTPGSTHTTTTRGCEHRGRAAHNNVGCSTPRSANPRRKRVTTPTKASRGYGRVGQTTEQGQLALLRHLFLLSYHYMYVHSYKPKEGHLLGQNICIFFVTSVSHDTTAVKVRKIS